MGYLQEPISISEGYFKDKGSKFIAFLIPVQNIEQADEELKKLKKTYFDARHVCYAWRIGLPPQEKAHDDGEPNYSAGAPILRRLKSHHLSNALIAVVRYFGGTKLGVSGLIHAYENSAEEAILLAEKRNIIPLSQAQVISSYEKSAHLNNLLARLSSTHQVRIVSSNYQEICSLTICFPTEYSDFIAQTLSNWDFLLDSEGS